MVENDLFGKLGKTHDLEKREEREGGGKRAIPIFCLSQFLDHLPRIIKRTRQRGKEKQK